MQTILSDLDIRYIVNAQSDAASDMEYLAEDLYNDLLAVAKATNLRKRFYAAMYHKRSTMFLLYQTPVLSITADHTLSVVLAMINHDVLNRFSVACGKGVHASYVVDNRMLNIYIEFCPEKLVAEKTPTNDTLDERRLEKETSW